ncbi:hypothetical protein TNCV_3796661 [Trichonephila clavipes]|nr:hypothetical protein TNCV_3796661 [Trichonephila clavipes]
MKSSHVPNSGAEPSWSSRMDDIDEVNGVVIPFFPYQRAGRGGWIVNTRRFLSRCAWLVASVLIIQPLGILDFRIRPVISKYFPENRLDVSFEKIHEGCGSPVVKVSNHVRHVMSSIPVPLKTRRVGICTLNLSRAETTSRALQPDSPQINLEVDSDDVQELLEFHNQQLTIDELIEMHEQERR